MPFPLRLALMAICVVVILGALGQRFGLLPNNIPFLARADLEGIELTRLERPEQSTPRTLYQASRGDLTGFGTSYSYSPDPDQGTRFRTERGVTSWGMRPEGADWDSDPRPVVILLHGAGRTGQSMVDMWAEVAMAENLILVAPDFGGLPVHNGGLYDPRAALDALDHAATMYPVDRNRVVLFGHSRGGIAAQLWANRLSGPWKAAAIHAGTLTDNLVRPLKNGIPIRHYLGSIDRTFPFPDGENGAKALAQARHRMELIRLQGHTHWFYETGEAISADARQWLRGHLPS